MSSFNNLMNYTCKELSDMFSNYQIFKYATDDLTDAERKTFIYRLHSCNIHINKIPKLFTKRGRPKR